MSTDLDELVASAFKAREQLLASPKAEWHFRQEGLPFPSEAEAAERWEPWKKNGAGTAWRRTLQQGGL
jgi:hypothetical protein